MTPAASTDAVALRGAERWDRMAWGLFGAVLLAFGATLVSFGDVWMAQPYTHGWLIAAATVWMVWNERDAFRESGEGWPLARLLAAGLSFAWFFAAVADVRFVSQAAAPCVLWAWCAAVYGKRVAARTAPALATALLAVPVWEILTRPLQLTTIAVSGQVIRLLGIPATLEGDLVHIEDGTFLIASGCAGLNYFMSGLTVGALYAYAFARQLRTRVAVVALAAILPILGNWFRVSSLIALGDYTRMQSIFITDSLAHILYGWSIFFVGLLVFFPLAGRITRRSGAHKQAPSHADSSIIVTGTHVRRLGLATLLAVTGPLAYYAISLLPTRTPGSFTLAGESAAWSPLALASSRPYTWQPGFVGADEHLESAWTNGTATVLIDRMVYHDQDQGKELIGYFSAIAPPEHTLVSPFIGSLAGGRRIVNVAVIRDESSPVLVWYWYRVGGIETASSLKAKLLEVPAFLTRATTAELIAVSTPCEAENCRLASETLNDFFGGVDG